MGEKAAEDQKFYDNLHPRKVAVQEEPGASREAAPEKGKKKKKKKPKNPKKQKNQKKRRKRIKLIVILLVFVLLAGTGGALYFLGALDPWIQKYSAMLSLQDRETAVEEREAALKNTETQLDRQQSKLDEQEQDLKNQEEQLRQLQTAEVSFQEYQDGLSEEELASLKQVSGIYSKMTPKTAAEVIAQMSDQNRAAIILYNMSSASAAAIMDAMTPEQAVLLTGIMTK